MTGFRPLLFVCCLLAIGIRSPFAVAQTIAVSLPDQSVEGKPVYWDQEMVALLMRDGQYITFPPSEAKQFRKLSGPFRSFSQSTLRGQLMREFGREFDVSGTGQYLVVHPTGQRDQWADRFEQLYRSMVHYFTARGFAVGRPDFPLVAVVFASRGDYLEHLRRNKVNGAAGSLGYYDPVTNRIQLYDVTADQANSQLWYLNAETIIHEAAHQTAFNIGIHPRFAISPTWVVEGIGTMFEAQGVWNAHDHPLLSERVNRSQLAAFRKLISPQQSAKVLELQLQSDRLFRVAPDVAYAHAWALTFFLTEREPQRFAQYLKRIHKHKPFQSYEASQRLQDFQAVFGSNLQMIDARLQRFVDTLD